MSKLATWVGSIAGCVAAAAAVFTVVTQNSSTNATKKLVSPPKVNLIESGIFAGPFKFENKNPNAVYIIMGSRLFELSGKALDSLYRYSTHALVEEKRSDSELYGQEVLLKDAIICTNGPPSVFTLEKEKLEILLNSTKRRSLKLDDSNFANCL